MTQIQRASVAKDMALGLYEEVGELVNAAIHYKAHLLEDAQQDASNVLEEVSDIFKYTVAIAQLYGITPDLLVKGFIAKSEVVRDRAAGQRANLETSKIIVSDLDGCIADLSGWENKLKGVQGGEPMGTGMVDVLESLKADFYRGGGFLDLPVIDGAREAIDTIRRWGYKVIIITARPYWQYKRLYSDTLRWLKSNGIEHDLMLFNKDKAEAIYEHIFPARPRYFIEDRDKHALELANIGINVLLMDKEGNRTIADNPLITRVKGWSEILEAIQ